MRKLEAGPSASFTRDHWWALQLLGHLGSAMHGAAFLVVHLCAAVQQLLPAQVLVINQLAAPLTTYVRGTLSVAPMSHWHVTQGHDSM